MESNLGTAEEAMKWWKDHTIVTSESDGRGFIEICPEWIDLPEADMAARDINDTHVNDLAKSYMKVGVGHLRGQVKILFFHHEVVQANLNPLDLRLAPFLESRRKPCKMYAIVGAHRSTALQKLRQQKPNNVKFARLKVEAALAHDSNDTRLKALTFGTLENTIQSVRLEADSWDYIAQIHRYYDSLKQKYGNRFPDHPDCSAKLSAYKKTCRATMTGYTSATLGNFFTIANTWGDLWINISTVMIRDRNKTTLTSTGKKSKAKATKKLGHSWLCDMSKIPEEQLVAWSRDVVREEILPAEFKQRCNTWKKHIKVQTFVVDWYNIEYQGEEDEIESYSELAEKYPFLQDEAFFEQMMMHYPSSGKVEVLPSGIADLLLQKIERTTAVRQCNCCYCFVFLYTPVKKILFFLYLYKYLFTKSTNTSKNCLKKFLFMTLLQNMSLCMIDCADV
jgi:hypothetical protein